MPPCSPPLILSIYFLSLVFGFFFNRWCHISVSSWFSVFFLLSDVFSTFVYYISFLCLFLCMFLSNLVSSFGFVWSHICFLYLSILQVSLSFPFSSFSYLPLLIYLLSFLFSTYISESSPSASHLWISLLPFLSLALYRLPPSPTTTTPLLRSNSTLINDVQETGCFYNTDTTLLPFFLSIQIPPSSLFHFVHTLYPPNLSCLLLLLAPNK